MLIIDTKDADTIDKLLRKYKKKFDQTGVVKQLRKRMHYTKKSIKNRQRITKAVYRDAVIREMEG